MPTPHTRFSYPHNITVLSKVCFLLSFFFLQGAEREKDFDVKLQNASKDQKGILKASKTSVIKGVNLSFEDLPSHGILSRAAGYVCGEIPLLQPSCSF